MSNRISQLPLEVVIQSDAPIQLRVSQLPLEVAVLSNAPIPARVSQLPIEVAVLTATVTSTEKSYVYIDEIVALG